MEVQIPWINNPSFIGHYEALLNEMFGCKYCFLGFDHLKPAFEYLNNHDTKIIITGVVNSIDSCSEGLDKRLDELIFSIKSVRSRKKDFGSGYCLAEEKRLNLELGKRSVEMIREIQRHKDTPVIFADNDRLYPDKFYRYYFDLFGIDEHIDLLTGFPQSHIKKLEKYLV